MFDELQIAHLHYGFVLPPPPSGSLNPSLTREDMDVLLRLLGLDRFTPGFQKSTIPYTVFVFLTSLSESNDPPSALWDLAESNPFYLARSQRLRALEILNDEIFVFEFDKKTATVPWRLCVTSAADALFICRLPEDMTEKDLARSLLERGVRFNTLLPRGLVTPSPLPSLDVNIVPKDYVFTLTDFVEYEAQKAALFKNPRVARAALIRGGILWRLALQSLSFDAVLDGPTSAVMDKNLGLCFQCDPVDLWDDDLSPTELQVICGVNLQFSDLQNSVHAQFSWWPQDVTWRNSHSQTYWSTADEAMFMNRWEKYRAGKAGPQKKGEWAKILSPGRHGAQDSPVQILNSCVEKFSLGFLKDFKNDRRRR